MTLTLRQQMESKIQRFKKYIDEDVATKSANASKTATEQAEQLTKNLKLGEFKRVEDETEKEIKEAKQELQVQESGSLNASRIEVLRVRDQIVLNLQDKCKEVMKNCKNYEELVEKLITQGAQLLDTKEIIVTICNGDDQVFQKVKPKIESQGIKITLSGHRLNKEDQVGGVFVSNMQQKIYIENTLKKRLLIAYKKKAPLISSMLFEDKSSLW